MRTSPEPFEVRDGVLYLEDLDLAQLTTSLEGVGAVWLLSRAALERATTVDAAPRTLDLDTLGPPAVLELVARAGWWARVASSHELSLARAAGFPAERIVAAGRAVDDGFLKDVLTEGVAVLQLQHAADQANAARIGEALGLPLPGAGGAPLLPPADAVARCGGLLARLLRGPPDLAVDAPLAVPADVHVYGLRPGDVQAGTLTGLSSAGGDVTAGGPAKAWIHGEPQRGDWVAAPVAGGLRAAVGVTHPEPPRLLVDGSRWRPLGPRPQPPAVEL